MLSPASTYDLSELLPSDNQGSKNIQVFDIVGSNLLSNKNLPDLERYYIGFLNYETKRSVFEKNEMIVWDSSTVRTILLLI